MFFSFMETALLAFPFESFCFDPFPNGQSDKWTPWRSWKADCKRWSVHSLKGCPSAFSLRSARLINSLRTLWSWVGGSFDLGLSSRLAKPSASKRLTQVIPDCWTERPAFKPVRAACSFGSSSMATITFTSWTKSLSVKCH
jgi:hypothetical protein